MKFLILFFFIISIQTAVAQKKCDCDSIEKDKSFSDYCTEYLNLRLFPVEKNKAQFKRYVFYQKGRKSKEYYNADYLLFKEKLLFNDKEISVMDSIMTLNGVYKIRDKKGIVIEEFLYKNGYLVKHLVKDKEIFHKKLIGKFVFEIAEFDYSTKPFRKHYTRYKPNGTIKYNLFTNYEDGIWYYDYTNILMSTNLLDFKGVPLKK
jgi:hypothetical protein